MKNFKRIGLKTDWRVRFACNRYLTILNASDKHMFMEISLWWDLWISSGHNQSSCMVYQRQSICFTQLKHFDPHESDFYTRQSHFYARQSHFYARQSHFHTRQNHFHTRQSNVFTHPSNFFSSFTYYMVSQRKHNEPQNMVDSKICEAFKRMLDLFPNKWLLQSIDLIIMVAVCDQKCLHCKIEFLESPLCIEPLPLDFVNANNVSLCWCNQLFM